MRKMHAERPDPLSRIKAGQEGIIVWDHKGVVIMWSEGHSSRFSWSTLRSLCACAECQRDVTQTPIKKRDAA
jgi:DUF971 family protein